MENITDSVVSAAPSVRLPVSSDGIVPERSEEFVVTAAIEALTARAMAYLEVGYPVHFAGAAWHGQDDAGVPRGGSAGPAGSPDSRRRRVRQFGPGRQDLRLPQIAHGGQFHPLRPARGRADADALGGQPPDHGLPERLHAGLRRVQPLAPGGEQRAAERPFRGDSESAEPPVRGPGLPAGEPGLPRDLHLEPGGIRRDSQDAGRTDGPADHDPTGAL